MTARTPAGAPPRAARITILDILRALALLGIVIVHAHDHFNLYLPMPPAEGWQAAANSAADWAYEHLFVSKSFLLFSFLFGLSFFIQLDRQEQKGVDFRKRFMWRLALLFLLGLAHTLFYDGDILTTTSFIASESQGIRHAPFFTFLIHSLTLACQRDDIYFQLFTTKITVCLYNMS